MGIHHAERDYYDEAMRIFVYECICAGGLGREAPASLRHEGRAMLEAIVADFQRLAGIEVVTLLDADARFAKSAASCDWTLVIAPEFDDLLLSRSQTVLDVGGRLLGSLPGAIHCTADKLEMARIWRRRGVRHPQTESAWDVALPCVVKPRHGAGAQATFLVCDGADQERVWRSFCNEWPHGDFIVQQYVAGQPTSVALLIGKAQTIPLLPARQHLSGDGRFHYEGGSLPLPKPLADRAIELALRAIAGIDGLQGYVGVDLVLGDGGDDYAIEINPRLTTSYLGLRQLCQQNLADLILRLAQGETIVAPTWHAGEVRFEA
jgi:predicted ATP-grasp superfamily ATP-dependent carboligase